MKYIHLLALTFAATAVTGCGSKKEENITDNAMPVTVAYPEIDSLVLHKSYPAYVTAIDETDIVARVNGFIVGKEFTDGEFVKKGHPMLSSSQHPIATRLKSRSRITIRHRIA